MKQEFEKVAKIWCCSRVTFGRASMFVALAKNVPSLVSTEAASSQQKKAGVTEHPSPERTPLELAGDCLVFLQPTRWWVLLRALLHLKSVR